MIARPRFLWNVVINMQKKQLHLDLLHVQVVVGGYQPLTLRLQLLYLYLERLKLGSLVRHICSRGWRVRRLHNIEARLRREIATITLCTYGIAL